MSNYYKYYHLRASPIGKQEQQVTHGIQVIPQPPPTQFGSANKQLSGQKQKQTTHTRGTSALPTQVFQPETSPWRAVQLPQGVQVIQAQQPVSVIQTNAFNDKSLQQFALEKQNECLRKEKVELENQVQKLKIYYTKQSALDQQELMSYEREKAALADKLREMDDNFMQMKDRYERDVAGDKLSAKKRQEQDGKLERITSYYNEQLQLKQEEIQKVKNKLQLQEINNSDLAAKLKIFEQTNKDLRAKWDEDIKNFGQEVEAHNRQLLKERYRNDELERSQKLNRLGSTNGSGDGSDLSSSYLKEIEVLRNSNVEKQARILELERKLKNDEVVGGRDTRGREEQQTSVIRERLEQKITESDRFRSELHKKSSEVEILAKENSQLQQRVSKLDSNHCEKDVLVQQMLVHIEQIERENSELKSSHFSSNGGSQLLEEKLQRISSLNLKQQQEIENISSELSRVNKKNLLLEDQLYNPNKLRLLQSQVETIDLRLSHLSAQVGKLNDISTSRTARGSSQPPNGVVGAVQRDMTDLQNEIEQIKRDLKTQQNGHYSSSTPQQFEAETGSYERLDTGDFSPSRNRVNGITSPVSGQQINLDRNDKSYTSLQSVYKKVTIPQPLIHSSKKNGQEHSVDLQDATDNSSQQTFGGNRKDSLEMQQQKEQIEFLIQKTKEEQEQLDQEAAKALLGSGPVTNHVSTDFQGSFGFGEPSTAAVTATQSIAASQQAIELLHPLRMDTELIELDILSILNAQSSDKLRYQFESQLEGKVVFDLVLGLVGCAGSGKTTVMNSIIKEEWDLSVPQQSSSAKKMQIVKYPCMGKQVALVESTLIGELPFMHFICNFTQALVLFFKSWDSQDQKVFADYVKLLQSEINFASELIVIHSDSHKLGAAAIEGITADLTRLQEGLYRGKLDGKLKKINVYHVMLHNHSDKTKNKSIFDEVIAVCKGTIIGKLTSSKEKVDVFKKLNRFLTA